MSTIRELIERFEREESSSAAAPRTPAPRYHLMGVTNVARSLVDGINDDDDIESDSDDEELRAIDTRNQGHLVLQRNNAVSGRITPGGHELDRDGWPIEPPMVVATAVADLPVIDADSILPVVRANVFVPGTPPRPPRTPVLRRNTLARNAQTQLESAEEQMAVMAENARKKDRELRDLRASLRRAQGKLDDSKRMIDELIDQNDLLVTENKRQRLEMEELAGRDEFPLDPNDFPILSLEAAAEFGFTGTGGTITGASEVIDLTEE
jgi:hypothetical protein